VDRPLEFRPEARLDVLDARDWYDGQIPGLGAEFVERVEASVDRIQRFPFSHAEVVPPIRKAVLRRFPFSLLYTVEPDVIVVLGCFHQRRDPVRWLDRR